MASTDRGAIPRGTTTQRKGRNITEVEYNPLQGEGLRYTASRRPSIGLATPPSTDGCDNWREHEYSHAQPDSPHQSPFWPVTGFTAVNHQPRIPYSGTGASGSLATVAVAGSMDGNGYHPDASQSAVPIATMLQPRRRQGSQRTVIPRRKRTVQAEKRSSSTKSAAANPASQEAAQFVFTTPLSIPPPETAIHAASGSQRTAIPRRKCTLQAEKGSSTTKSALANPTSQEAAQIIFTRPLGVPPPESAIHAATPIDGPDENLVCTVCSRIFGYHGNLQRHLHSSHSSGLPFRYLDCGRRFPRSDYLKYHQWMHEADDNVQEKALEMNSSEKGKDADPPCRGCVTDGAMCRIYKGGGFSRRCSNCLFAGDDCSLFRPKQKKDSSLSILAHATLERVETIPVSSNAESSLNVSDIHSPDAVPGLQLAQSSSTNNNPDLTSENVRLQDAAATSSRTSQHPEGEHSEAVHRQADLLLSFFRDAASSDASGDGEDFQISGAPNDPVNEIVSSEASHQKREQTSLMSHVTANSGPPVVENPMTISAILNSPPTNSQPYCITSSTRVPGGSPSTCMNLRAKEPTKLRADSSAGQRHAMSEEQNECREVGSSLTQEPWTGGCVDQDYSAELLMDPIVASIGKVVGCDVVAVGEDFVDIDYLLDVGDDVMNEGTDVVNDLGACSERRKTVATQQTDQLEVALHASSATGGSLQPALGAPERPVLPERTKNHLSESIPLSTAQTNADLGTYAPSTTLNAPDTTLTTRLSESAVRSIPSSELPVAQPQAPIVKPAPLRTLDLRHFEQEWSRRLSNSRTSAVAQQASTLETTESDTTRASISKLYEGTRDAPIEIPDDAVALEASSRGTTADSAASARSQVLSDTVVAEKRRDRDDHKALLKGWPLRAHEPRTRCCNSHGWTLEPKIARALSLAPELLRCSEAPLLRHSNPVPVARAKDGLKTVPQPTDLRDPRGVIEDVRELSCGRAGNDRMQGRGTSGQCKPNVGMSESEIDSYRSTERSSETDYLSIDDAVVVPLSSVTSARTKTPLDSCHNGSIKQYEEVMEQGLSQLVTVGLSNESTLPQSQAPQADEGYGSATSINIVGIDRLLSMKKDEKCNFPSPLPDDVCKSEVEMSAVYVEDDDYSSWDGFDSDIEESPGVAGGNNLSGIYTAHGVEDPVEFADYCRSTRDDLGQAPEPDEASMDRAPLVENDSVYGAESVSELPRVANIGISAAARALRVDTSRISSDRLPKVEQGSNSKHNADTYPPLVARLNKPTVNQAVFARETTFPFTDIEESENEPPETVLNISAKALADSIPYTPASTTGRLERLEPERRRPKRSRHRKERVVQIEHTTGPTRSQWCGSKVVFLNVDESVSARSTPISGSPLPSAPSVQDNQDDTPRPVKKKRDSATIRSRWSGTRTVFSELERSEHADDAREPLPSDGQCSQKDVTSRRRKRKRDGAEVLVEHVESSGRGRDGLDRSR
ncbi:hypothetical protein LTR50_004306 [Elasticomyces elasticus]|nr:hypothetical protein LTR50_004306 [Elasticomyces elasticus]